MTELFEIFRRSMMAAGPDSRQQAFEIFLSDPDLSIEALARDYFDRHAASWVVRGNSYSVAFQREEPEPVKRPVPEPEAVAARAEAKEKIAEEIKARVRNVVLLNLELPNGKTLRQSTGAECAKAGGFFAEVAKHIKATEVVDKHLTETDLQNIKRRIYK